MTINKENVEKKKYEVVRKNDNWIVRDKRDKGRRKTYLKSELRGDCIKQMRRLYLSDARSKRKIKKKINNNERREKRKYIKKEKPKEEEKEET